MSTEEPSEEDQRELLLRYLPSRRRGHPNDLDIPPLCWSIFRRMTATLLLVRLSSSTAGLWLTLKAGTLAERCRDVPDKCGAIRQAFATGKSYRQIYRP